MDKAGPEGIKKMVSFLLLPNAEHQPKRSGLALSFPIGALGEPAFAANEPRPSTVAPTSLRTNRDR